MLNLSIYFDTSLERAIVSLMIFKETTMYVPIFLYAAIFSQEYSQSIPYQLNASENFNSKICLRGYQRSEGPIISVDILDC